MDPRTSHRDVYRKPLQNRKTPRAKDKGENTRSARTRAGISGGSAAATASSREDVPQLSLTRPGPAPRRRASSKGPPLARREASARSLPFPSAGRGGKGAGRGGARSRAACSRTSPGFGCVRPAARPLPPPPPRFPFAGRRLRGAGASYRRRNAAGVHRPPELPGPGARCGALL